jgi:acyl carrier protein
MEWTTMRTSEEEVLALIAKEISVDQAQLRPEAKLSELGIASLDVMSVLFAVEDHFAVQIDPRELESLESVGAVVRLLTARINGSSA